MRRFARQRTATRAFAPPVTKSMIFRRRIRLDRPPEKMRQSIYSTDFNQGACCGCLSIRLIGHPASACPVFAEGLVRRFARQRTATRAFAPPVTTSMIFRPRIRLDRPPKKMRLSIYSTYLCRLSIYSTYLHRLSIYSTHLASGGGLVRLFARMSLASRAFAPPVQ